MDKTTIACDNCHKDVCEQGTYNKKMIQLYVTNIFINGQNHSYEGIRKLDFCDIDCFISYFKTVAGE